MSYILSPEWAAARTRYQTNAAAFCSDVLNWELTKEQTELLHAVQHHSKSLYMPNPDDATDGLYMGYAMLTLWYLTCFPEAHVGFFSTLPNALRSQIWKRVSQLLSDVKNSGAFPELLDAVIVSAKSIYIEGYKELWCCSVHKIGSDLATLTGLHHPHYLAVVDFAQSVPDAVFDVISAGRAGIPSMSILLTVNKPIIARDSLVHRILSPSEGSDWCVVGQDGSPITVWNPWSLHDRGSYLLSDAHLRDVYHDSIAEIDPSQQQFVLGCFVEGRDSYLSLGRLNHLSKGSLEIIEIEHFDGLFDDIYPVVKQYFKKYKNLEIMLSGEMASYFYNYLSMKGLESECVFLGQCFHESHRNDFTNYKSKMFVNLSRGVRDRKFKILKNALPSPKVYEQKISQQMLSLPYEFDDLARYNVSQQLIKDPHIELSKLDVLFAIALGYLAEGVQ